MDDSSHAAILDRDSTLADIHEHFADRIRVQREVVDYGTNLIVRCLHGSKKSLVDTVVLSGLTKQTVEMLDGASVLLESGAAFPALLQVRSMFECGVFARWILSAERRIRAEAYYVAHLRRELQANLAVIPGTTEHESLNDDFSTLRNPPTLKSVEIQKAAKKRVQDIKTHLSKDDLVEINSKFDERRGSRKYDPAWYRPLFPKKERPTLKTLAREVERLPDYKVLYEQGSIAMHGYSLSPHICIGDGTAKITGIRNLSQYPLVSRLAIGEALSLYRYLLDVYRPEETQNFAKKYQDSWRPVFLRDENVTYGEPLQTTWI